MNPKKKKRGRLREKVIPENFECGVILIRGFVIAGRTAWLAIHQPVLANTDVERCLAETTEFVALATLFRHLTLCATVFDAAASGGHSSNVALQRAFRKRAVGNRNSIYNSWFNDQV
jgi:hypothetical protein